VYITSHIDSGFSQPWQQRTCLSVDRQFYARRGDRLSALGAEELVTAAAGLRGFSALYSVWAYLLSHPERQIFWRHLANLPVLEFAACVEYGCERQTSRGVAKRSAQFSSA
jgi:hypothetical protein